MSETPTAPVLVEAIGLTKFFSIGRNQTVHAVDNVSLQVHEREIVGLVGETGSGSPRSARR
jgi:oligopeptide transport system ATP-binding protein